MNGTLYRIINMKNNKSYIGKTYRTIYDRLSEHISDYTRKQSIPLYLAFSKYGIENFTLEILGCYPQGILEEEEIKAIKAYNSYLKGYNATLGGDGGKLLDLNVEEVVQDYLINHNMIEVAKKYNCSPSTIRNLLIANSIDIERPKSAGPAVKEIYSPSLDMTFKEAKECALYLTKQGIAKGDITSICKGIRRAASGERKTYLQHTFAYLDSTMERSIYSPTLDMDFPTVKDCAHYLVTNKLVSSESSLGNVESSIRQTCVGYRGSYKNMVFLYKYKNIT